MYLRIIWVLHERRKPSKLIPLPIVLASKPGLHIVEVFVRYPLYTRLGGGILCNGRWWKWRSLIVCMFKCDVYCSSWKYENFWVSGVVRMRCCMNAEICLETVLMLWEIWRGTLCDRCFAEERGELQRRNVIVSRAVEGKKLRGKLRISWPCSVDAFARKVASNVPTMVPHKGYWCWKNAGRLSEVVSTIVTTM